GLLRRLAETLAAEHTVSIHELGSRHSLLSLGLQFHDLKRCTGAASHNEVALPEDKLAGLEALEFDWFCPANLKLLVAKRRVRARPGLESPQSIVDFVGRAAKVNRAIFFCEDGSQGSLGVVLWARPHSSSLQSAKRFDHQVRPDFSQSNRQRLRRVLERDRHLALQEDVPGIQAGIDAHRGHTGYGFAIRDSPLDGSGPAILRQKGRVQVQISQRREINHPLRDDAAIADHNDPVRFQVGESGLELLVLLDLVGLHYRNPQACGGLLDRRRREFHAASPGPVRLRNYQAYRKSGVCEPLQRRNCKLWRAAEDETRGRWSH